MDTLIELALLALAAYGIKSYLLTTEPLADREIFPTRGTTFVKRLVKQSPTTADVLDVPAIRNVSVTGQPVETLPAAADYGAEPEVSIVSDLSDNAASISPIPECLPETAESSVPEDSILKRHYLAQKLAELASIQTPYPTDSVLRRHANQMQAVLLASFGSSTVATTDDGACLTTDSQRCDAETLASALVIPEDSVLRRHYNQLIQGKAAAL